MMEPGSARLLADTAALRIMPSADKYGFLKLGFEPTILVAGTGLSVLARGLADADLVCVMTEDGNAYLAPLGVLKVHLVHEPLGPTGETN